MKIGFAGRWNPMEKKAWSGTYFYAYQAIKKRAAVQAFYYNWPWLLRERLIFEKQLQKLNNKKVAVEFLRSYAQWFSKQLEKDLRRTKLDILFVPAAPQLVAYCKTDVPVVYMADATFQQLQGYYDSFSNLAAYNIRQGIALDKRTFENASHCMLASEWAKQSAVEDYHIPAHKLTVAPLGANIDIIPGKGELKKEKNKICQLLFLGVEWERKGGQVALDTLEALNRSGLRAQLTIIGCVPPVPVDKTTVTIIPFLNKNNSSEAGRLYHILRNSDLLLLPTKAECAGVVFCEASAFGLPSITTDTGGVNTYVQNGVNGFTLPLNAAAADYATLIQELLEDKPAYQLLCASSRNKFEETLNWDCWGERFHDIAEKILNR